ncbi:MAG: hypothetical protein FH762_03055 [Firmicutes bacterium]|nr:hypothetical protein [Bacillota bacterium]
MRNRLNSIEEIVSGAREGNWPMWLISWLMSLISLNYSKVYLSLVKLRFFKKYIRKKGSYNEVKIT